MTSWTLYIITRASAVQSAFLALTVVTSIVLGISVLFWFTARSGMDEEFGTHIGDHLARMFRWLVPLTVTATVLCVCIPTTPELAAIIVLPKIVNSPAVQKESQELYDIAKAWLKQQAKIAESRHQ